MEDEKINIDDFKIIVKKYDKGNNFVILNLLICGVIEVRGFRVRYTPTKHSINPIWIVSPPSVKGRGGLYFWIFQLKNTILWQKLESRMIKEAQKEANDI